jgi:hypothetical protein
LRAKKTDEAILPNAWRRWHATGLLPNLAV